MYKITKIENLPRISGLVQTDAVLAANDDNIQMSAVDKTYSTSSYLTDIYNSINSLYNSLQTFENNIITNYFTQDLSSTYITADTLIHASDITDILAVGLQDGFLTRTKAEALRSECITLIQQLKEKVMNLFTANLDYVFKKQQSIDALPYGGSNNAMAGSLGENITQNEDSANGTNQSYDLLTGQFSLINLLQSNEFALTAPNNFWTEFCPNGNFDFEAFTDIQQIIDKIAALSDAKGIGTYGFLNETDDLGIGNIQVPDNVYDTEAGRIIPAGVAVFEILKRQIYVVIKNIYINYLVPLTKLPTQN